MAKLNTADIGFEDQIWKAADKMRGIEADLGQYNADTFFNDCHPTLEADFVLANPLPFAVQDLRYSCAGGLLG
jgi:hypothetical protein